MLHPAAQCQSAINIRWEHTPYEAFNTNRSLVATESGMFRTASFIPSTCLPRTVCLFGTSLVPHTARMEIVERLKFIANTFTGNADADASCQRKWPHGKWSKFASFTHQAQLIRASVSSPDVWVESATNCHIHIHSTVLCIAFLLRCCCLSYCRCIQEMDKKCIRIGMERKWVFCFSLLLWFSFALFLLLAVLVLVYILLLLLYFSQCTRHSLEDFFFSLQQKI